MMSRKRRILIVGVSASVGVAILLILVLVPVPQHFSVDGAAIYDLQTTCTGIDTTQGTTVSLHWSTPSTTYFAVVSCSLNQVAYEANGTQGSTTFTSVGGVYEFGALCPEGPCIAAHVSGDYTGPLLAV